MAQNQIQADYLFNRIEILISGTEYLIGIDFFFQIQDDNDLRNDSNVTCKGDSITVKAPFSHQCPMTADFGAPAYLIQNYLNEYKQVKKKMVEIWTN